jgi:serine/threonine protein kinase
MLLFIAQFIQEIFGMRKVKPEPANRRPIVAPNDAQRIEGNGLTYQNHVAPRHVPPRRIFVDSLKRPRTIAWKGDQASIEQEHDIKPASSPPKYLLEPTQTLAVKHAAPKVPTSHTDFNQNWRHCRTLGEGGDGIVYQYQRRKRTNESIAVKVPQSSSACIDLKREVLHLRRIGPHEHILTLKRDIANWIPYGPALLLEYCELGDLTKYRKAWCKQQKSQGLPERVSEITLCKLFRDIALALDHIHNGLDKHYVHNDLKPQNILAFKPIGYTEDDRLPEEPTFKVSDFARLTPFPTPIGRGPKGFDGTYEYAPPKQEQAAPVLSSADIWSLGATLQYMALGIDPVQSRKAFIWSRKGANKSHPGLDDEEAWKSELWRRRIPTVFRPINLPTSVLIEFYDLPHDLPDYQPFSARLAYWYAKLYKPVGTRNNGRPGALRLVREAVPNLVDQIERLKIKRFQEMQRIRDLQHKEAVAAGELTELE